MHLHFESWIQVGSRLLATGTLIDAVPSSGSAKKIGSNLMVDPWLVEQVQRTMGVNTCSAGVNFSLPKSLHVSCRSEQSVVGFNAGASSTSRLLKPRTRTSQSGKLGLVGRFLAVDNDRFRCRLVSALNSSARYRPHVLMPPPAPDLSRRWACRKGRSQCSSCFLRHESCPPKVVVVATGSIVRAAVEIRTAAGKTLASFSAVGARRRLHALGGPWAFINISIVFTNISLLGQSCRVAALVAAIYSIHWQDRHCGRGKQSQVKRSLNS